MRFINLPMVELRLIDARTTRVGVDVFVPVNDEPTEQGPLASIRSIAVGFGPSSSERILSSFSALGLQGNNLKLGPTSCCHTCCHNLKLGLTPYCPILPPGAGSGPKLRPRRSTCVDYYCFRFQKSAELGRIRNSARVPPQLRPGASRLTSPVAISLRLGCELLIGLANDPGRTREHWRSTTAIPP
jgi:hypothetical protein